MDGPTVLLVEDEPLILMDLDYAVQDRGLQSACASDVREALELLDREGGVAAAVLDITLQNGESCLPIAQELERRAIPYVLHSGEMKQPDQDVDRLSGERIAKPAAAAEVVARALNGTPIPTAKARG